MLDQPVVLGVEDVVDGGQADVLVDAAVAGDVVRVEQLVVVGARRLPASTPIDVDRRRRQRHAPVWLLTGLALCAMSSRKAWPVRSAADGDRVDRRQRVAGHQHRRPCRDAVGAGADDDLREAVRRRG